MAKGSVDLVEQVDRHFDSSNQAWLLGAGISFDAGLPLMAGLTAQVRSLSQGQPHQGLIDAVVDELPASAHIEHVLSQLGDYSAIAARVATNSVAIGGRDYSLNDLQHAHEAVTNAIAETIRWGYVAANGEVPALVGSRGSSLTKVEHHSAFVRAIFEKRHAGLWDRRRPIHFFTTNYDTLLEDALSLGKYSHWDGFHGGAVAYRSHKYGASPKFEGMRAAVVKLHGSIDWVLGEEGSVWRVRDADTYPAHRGRVLIHPQSTKYVSTQKDPFAAQFDIFRRVLGGPDELVLGVVGYSFGDDHVNEELDRALSAPGGKITLIAFCRENDALPACLRTWLASRHGDSVFVLTEKAIHWGGREPAHVKVQGEHGWWTFNGVTSFLQNGGHSHE
ncbi:SIR2 family protein [Stenotrophomonas maltophilia]|uniref:SIR2 family protein n=1 Tax=Stenotrophomonas maltophilia TaxID=40324 RepID=UPI000C267FC6|nr:SIR2 family protein [Stenotrophomonas maltophilia]PJL44147.1 hypothetical protein B9Y56_05465 [Stenotrophomonas maltophilia]